MAELKRCPECGGVAIVIHMYDTYDRADFGWDAGCGRYRAGDGLHTKKMKVCGLPSKEKAIEAWNRRATLNWTERLRRKLIHKLGGVLMDEVQPRPVAAAESYTTEELTCSYLKFAGGQENERLKMDNLTLMGCEAEKAGLIEWKEVPREEKPTLYKAMEGIPGAEDAVLMHGTLRVLRKERG